MSKEPQNWTLRLYRDDSETTVVFEDVKHVFMTAGNTVLTIAQYAEDGSHHYINYPRERVCWWKLSRALEGSKRPDGEGMKPSSHPHGTGAKDTTATT